jgi:hypothetical protein
VSLSRAIIWLDSSDKPKQVLIDKHHISLFQLSSFKFTTFLTYFFIKLFPDLDALDSEVEEHVSAETFESLSPISFSPNEVSYENLTSSPLYHEIIEDISKTEFAKIHIPKTDIRKTDIEKQDIEKTDIVKTNIVLKDEDIEDRKNYSVALENKPEMKTVLSPQKKGRKNSKNKTPYKSVPFNLRKQPSRNVNIKTSDKYVSGNFRRGIKRPKFIKGNEFLKLNKNYCRMRIRGLRLRGQNDKNLAIFGHFRKVHASKRTKRGV